MYILFEEHQYKSHLVEVILKDIYVLQDVDKNVSVQYVGYFYNPYLHDCVFVLPKVLLTEHDTLVGMKFPSGEEVTPEIFGTLQLREVSVEELLPRQEIRVDLKSVEELLKVMPLKWLAASIGVEKIVLKSSNMFLYLLSDFNSSFYESESFDRIITYASWHPRNTKIREQDGRRSLWVKEVNSVSQAVSILEEIIKK